LDLLSGADLGTGGGVEMEQQRKKFVEFLGNTEKGLSDSGKAAKANAEQLDDVTGSMESLTEASKIYNGQLAFIAATQKLGADRAAAYNKAIEDTTTLDDQATAAFGMNTAYKGLFDTLNDLPKEFDVIKAALGDYTDEQNKAVEAVINFGDTAGGVLEQAVSTGGDPRMLGGIFRKRLEEVLKNAGIPPEQISEYIGLAGLGELQIEAAVRISLSEEEKQKFLNLLALFEATSQEFAPEILPKINELFLAGEFQKLNALIAASQPGVTQTELFLYLTAYPDLAGPLAGTIAALQAQADADAVALRATMFPPGSMIADLMANLQAEANAAPPVVIPFQLPGAPGSGLPTLPNRGNLPPGINPSDLPVQQAEIDTGLDFNFNGIIGRAIGGPVGGGRTYMVNERGRELFTPNSNGFIMNAGDAQALLQGVSQLVSSGGGGMVNNFTVITPDAETAASATARKLRDAAWRN
jgi:hypothetical protein